MAVKFVTCTCVMIRKNRKPIAAQRANGNCSWNNAVSDPDYHCWWSAILSRRSVKRLEEARLEQVPGTRWTLSQRPEVIQGHCVWPPTWSWSSCSCCRSTSSLLLFFVAQLLKPESQAGCSLEFCQSHGPRVAKAGASKVAPTLVVTRSGLTRSLQHPLVHPCFMLIKSWLV